MLHSIPSPTKNVKKNKINTYLLLGGFSTCPPPSWWRRISAYGFMTVVWKASVSLKHMPLSVISTDGGHLVEQHGPIMLGHFPHVHLATLPGGGFRAPVRMILKIYNFLKKICRASRSVGSSSFSKMEHGFVACTMTMGSEEFCIYKRGGIGRHLLPPGGKTVWDTS